MCTLSFAGPQPPPLSQSIIKRWGAGLLHTRTLRGWERIGYEVNIGQSLINDPIVILYRCNLRITTSCQKGPMSGWVVTYGRVPCLLCGWQTHSARLCVGFLGLCTEPGLHQAKMQQKPSTAIIFTNFSPRGNFSQFNCLGDCFLVGFYFKTLFFFPEEEGKRRWNFFFKKSTTP